MNSPVFLDVTAGKPRRIEEDSDGNIIESLDLLWRYGFKWVTIDRWDLSDSHGRDAGVPEDTKAVKLEVATEPHQFTEVEVTHFKLISAKGSRGTHQSIQILLAKEARGRFLRVTIEKHQWKYRVRLSLRPAEVLADESAKLIEPMPLTIKQKWIDNPLNVGILGGSNSVMRYGWVQGLSSAGIKVAHNASLGSSSNAIFASRLRELDNYDLDVVILNSTVNDYIPMRDGRLNLELLRDLTRFVLSWCARKNIIPIFLIYPQRRIVDDAAKGIDVVDHEEFYKEQCEDLDIPYINLFETFEEVTAISERPVDSFYKDEAHLNHATAQLLGALVGQRLRHFMESELPAGEVKTLPGHFTKDFTTKPLVANSELYDQSGKRVSLVSRRIQTSIVDSEMVVLELGQKLDLFVGAEWEVIGFTMNARRSNISLKIEGDYSVSRRCDFAGYGGKDGFPFVCSRSLERAVDSSVGVISLIPVLPDPTDEFDEIANPHIANTPPQLGEIEIAEVILRSKRRSVPYLRVRGIKLDLTGNIPLDQLIGQHM